MHASARIPANHCARCSQALFEGDAKKQLQPLRLALERCAAQERAIPFLYPAAGYPDVDKIAYLGYIPCPMDLGLVRRRIENEYYRTFDAVKADLETIVETCELWHNVGSDLAQRAREIVDWLLPFATADAVSKTCIVEQLFDQIGSGSSGAMADMEEDIIVVDDVGTKSVG